MADIRINSLPTTATSTSFDDYVAVDGSGNGTRKLSAYSPTFGGNLTVSGSANLTSSSLNSYIYDGTGWVWTSTGTSGGTVKGGIYAAGGLFFITANSSLATNRFSLNSSGDATVAGNLTVSGAGWNTFAGSIATTGANSLLQASTSIIDHSSGTFRAIGYGPNTSTAGGFSFIGLSSNGSVGGTRFSIDSSGNSTFAGNLTVSGGTITGGTSGMSLASGGTNQNITLTPSGTGSVNISPVGTTNPIRIGINLNSPSYSMLTFNNVFNGSGCLGLTAGGGTDTTLYFNVPTGGTYNFRVNDNPLIKFDTNGNLTVSGTGNSSVAGTWLIGTTTNSGNGKLQLATHTTSAGGIGFGTDQTIYRYNSTAMGLAGVTDLFIQSGNSGLWLGSAAGSYQVGIARSALSGLLFYAGSGGLALTLDGSLNATFAGNTVKISNAASPQLNFNNVGVRDWYAGVQTANDRLVFGTSVSSSGGHAIRIDSALNVYVPNGELVLTNALKLGNAYTAGAPTATGYVTIKDSAGNTYKVLVGT